MKGQTAQPDANRLIELLSQQRDLYRSLQALSERQRTLISGDRPELLLNILRDRQDLVTSLAHLNEDLGPYRRNWDATYAALPENMRAQASEILHDINALLRAILRTDQEDGALLSARKESTATEMANNTGAQIANNAYAKQATTGKTNAADMTG